jgi:hypothetical protein
MEGVLGEKEEEQRRGKGGKKKEDGNEAKRKMVGRVRLVNNARYSNMDCLPLCATLILLPSSP